MRAFSFPSLFQTRLIWHVLADRADTETNLWLHHPPTATNCSHWHILINVLQPHLSVSWEFYIWCAQLCCQVPPTYTNLAFYPRVKQTHTKAKYSKPGCSSLSLPTPKASCRGLVEPQGTFRNPRALLGLGLSPGQCRQSLHKDTAPGLHSPLNSDIKILNPSPQTQTSLKSPPRIPSGWQRPPRWSSASFEPFCSVLGRDGAQGLENLYFMHSVRSSKAQF